MTPPTGKAVPIPRNVLAALLAGLVALLLAVASLLVRESKHGPPALPAALAQPPATAPVASVASGEESPATAPGQIAQSLPRVEASGATGATPPLASPVANDPG